MRKEGSSGRWWDGKREMEVVVYQRGLGEGEEEEKKRKIKEMKKEGGVGKEEGGRK